MRAAAPGSPSFRTRPHPFVRGTPVGDGKPEKHFNGVRTILERGIVADLALVRAHRADLDGNLRYRLTARYFNPLVAAAGQVTIAEAEDIATLHPDDVHTPGIYVQHLTRTEIHDKDIEQRTVRARVDA